MTARLVIAQAASADQTDILIDLNTVAGLQTATKYRARLRAVYERLADHPASGPRRPALGPNIRIGVVTPYIVIYEYTASDDTVTILRIIHGRRDVTRLSMTSGRR